MDNQKKKYSLVWITKYRRPILCGTYAYQVREAIRQVCNEIDVDILQGSVKKDRIHLTVLAPTHISLPQLMQKIKGKSAHIILKEYSNILGRPLWAKGYFARELK